MTYEHFLDPHQPEAANLLDNLRGQAYLKALIINPLDSSVIDMLEFPNNYIDDRLVPVIRKIQNEPHDSFQQAQLEFQKSYSIEHLLSI